MSWKNVLKRFQREDRAHETVGEQKKGMKEQIKQFELEDEFGAYEAKQKQDAADLAEVQALQAKADAEAAQNAADFDAIYEEGAEDQAAA